MHRCLLLLVALATCLVPGRAIAEDGEPQWIVVTAPAFHDVVGALAEHRARQGHEVTHLRAEEVARGATEPTIAAARIALHVQRACRRAEGRCTVLLVGVPIAADGVDAAAVLPGLPGTQRRMRMRPTDNGYGRLDGDFVPDVAVGRFPARTVAEAQAMVDKTIAFEHQPPPGPWRERIALIVGNPGGASPLERGMASHVVRTSIFDGLRALDDRWFVDALVHMPESAYCVPDEALSEASLDLLREGQMLSVYLGHSGAGGLWSDGNTFVSREQWHGTPFGPRAGILLSCGCHTCESADGWGGEGFGLFAFRNPRGPVAVVGANGESAGAMGKLAFEGLLPVLEQESPPARLGAWWLAMARGLGEGDISATAFFLFDQVDGSGGEVPLEDQRNEHLEMWGLLGDPALRLPVDPRTLALEVEEEPAREEGVRVLHVRGRLPEDFPSGPRSAAPGWPNRPARRRRSPG